MKLNLRNGRLERDTMTMSHGTEKAIIDLRQMMPKAMNIAERLVAELKRYNDRVEERDKRIEELKKPALDPTNDPVPAGEGHVTAWLGEKK